MRLLRRRRRDSENRPDEEDARQENGTPNPSRTDILAGIIALFELILPLILGLLVVGVIVDLILR
jgi:hypothetical protein